MQIWSSSSSLEDTSPVERPHLPRRLSPRAGAEAFRTQMPVKFDTADEDVWINGVAVTIRDDGRADSIEQLLVPPQPEL
jgi:hypothetical protein